MVLTGTVLTETVVTSIQRAGVLLPEAVLATPWFTVLAAFVAFNTVLNLCLALMKIFPAPRSSWRRRNRRRENEGVRRRRSPGGPTRRSETRNIDPDGPV